MTAAPTRIDAAFLRDPAFRAVAAALAVDGDRIRVVGGAVRNTLMGEPVSDVDVATTARPEVVAARAVAAGLKAIPTGIEHGTVTVVADGTPFEVTTLRADVETDGRRAVVAFTDDWAADAGRRDFTMNAIYADPDGTLHDPTGGIADALAGRVRFIGRPEDRIREDYLRILRFFRFHARYGRGTADAGALAACVDLRAGLDRLSRERIGAEWRKLVSAPRAAETIALMAEEGVLAHVLGRPGRPERLARALDLAAAAGLSPDPMLPTAAVALDGPADAEPVADRLRLANAERDRLAALGTWAERLGPDPGADAVRLAVYRVGNEIAAGAIVLAAARAGTAAPATLALARDWPAPVFPLGGRDLLAAGMAPGPALGARLKALEDAWIASGFTRVPSIDAG